MGKWCSVNLSDTGSGVTAKLVTSAAATATVDLYFSLTVNNVMPPPKLKHKRTDNLYDVILYRYSQASSSCWRMTWHVLRARRPVDVYTEWKMHLKYAPYDHANISDRLRTKNNFSSNFFFFITCHVVAGGGAACCQQDMEGVCLLWRHNRPSTEDDRSSVANDLFIVTFFGLCISK